MSVTPSSHVVGVFTDHADSEQAIQALHNAGFEPEHIRYSGPSGSGSFFEDLKSLFTGTNANAQNLANDLADMGLSHDEVQYYADEYQNGNVVLAVNAPRREQEALQILREYGAHSTTANSRMNSDFLNDTGSTTTSSSDYVRSGENSNLNEQSHTWETQPVSSTTEGQTLEHQDVSDLDIEDQPTQIVGKYPHTYHDAGTAEYEADNHLAQSQSVVHDHAVEDQVTPGVTTPEYSDELPTSSTTMDTGYSADHVHDSVATSDNFTHDQPVVTSYDSEPESALASQSENYVSEDDVVTPEYKANTTDADTGSYHDDEDTVAQADMVAPEHKMDEHLVQSGMAGGLHSDNVDNSTMTSEYSNGDYTSQASTMEPVSTTEDQFNDGYTPAQDADLSTPTGALSHQYVSKLQSLQQQLEETKRRLEKERSRLQAAKEHEKQIQAAKEQLQAIQAELDATQAELRDTHSRLEQY